MNRTAGQIIDGPDGTKIFTAMLGGPIMPVMATVMQQFDQMGLSSGHIIRITIDHALPQPDGVTRWAIHVDYRP